MNEFAKDVRIVGVYSREVRGQDGTVKKRYEVECLVEGVGTYRCSTFAEQFGRLQTMEGQNASVKVRVRAYKDRLYYTVLDIVA